MSSDHHDREAVTVVERLEQLERLAQTTDHEAAVVHGLADLTQLIRECVDDGLRDCVHCGSPFTFRRSDGDIGCYDCRGIMPEQYRCDGCGATGTRDDLADDECAWYDDGGHHVTRDIRICPWCGEQGTPHDLQKHDCEVVE